MASPVTSYAEINKAVEDLIDKHVENDPTVTAYMIARAAVLQVRGLRGPGKAGKIAYRIADEMAGESR